MPELLTPAEIERLGADLGLTPQQVCERADINYTTFWRWKTGRSEPGISIYKRLVDAVSPLPESIPQRKD